MGYADFGDVQARAGRFAGAFAVAGKRPDEDDVSSFLTDVSAEIDAAIRGRALDPAAIDADGEAALKDLAAYGALVRALDALPDSGDELTSLRDRAAAIWAAGVAGIRDGTNSVVTILTIAEGDSRGQRAGALWTEEPCYGTTVPSPLNPALAPAFRRGQEL